jgi:diguanylate cyclase (GGDEF)-like protein
MERRATDKLWKRMALVWPLVAILTISGAIAGVMYLPVPVVEYMLKHDIQRHAELWNRRVVSHLDDARRTFSSGQVTVEEDQFLSLLPEASDVYRFKMFQADGTVFWSTRPADMGTINTKEYFVRQVANGDTYYKQATKPAAEIDGIQLHAHSANADSEHEIAEIYIPVMDNGRFIGAIEFYTDITDIRALFITRVQGALTVLSVIASLIVLTIGAVIAKSNRTRFHALRGRAEKERRMMDQQLNLAREVKLLGELNEWLQSSRSLTELFDMVSRFMTHMLPEAEGTLYVYSNSRDVLDGSASWNGGDYKPHIHPDACWGLRRGRTYQYGGHEIDFVCEHAEPHDDRPYFCFPILAHGETVGLMHLRMRPDSDAEAFRDCQKLAQMSAEQISMAIANVRMRDQLQEQSIRDPLTGLYNRRHMLDRLRRLLDKSRSDKEQVCLAYVDVDHFKTFNDNHGHDAGDVVLRTVAEVFAGTCDGDDIACRMGGEEFMMIWPGAKPEAAMRRAEELRLAIANLSVRYGEKTLPKITISAGLAFFPDHGVLPQDLLRVADDAMYRAKANGRNQVVSAKQIKASDSTKDAPKIDLPRKVAAE